ncbi:NitT/TauT family transport system permease protein|uniref:NitT/TauT family transport system permease protein n=1 Tax=Brenneria salicis ATCC 15712 = DSM 30166 TaxID=714314 RepID=A0A366I982_9GAMM|nr:ABC transporter permease [Brenneria salicis]NMN90007.1 NitT/TauT family transport system permease protein [Brenneria salicis ATCC 15712 = DSM 30166]RBP64349.1 NitT/TauT family transport system permease protein [Brenneria salicis ATCC 15712 = DSM 30166]RLM31433.1 ABC transporter permease [Brenneria salicis ATCC 15712 = DSM 30166]
MRKFVPGGIGLVAALITSLLGLGQTLPDVFTGADSAVTAVLLLLLWSTLLAMLPLSSAWYLALLMILIAAAAWLLLLPDVMAQADTSYWLAILALGLLACHSVQRLATFNSRKLPAGVVATLFGVWVIYFWQLLVTAFAVPQVLLPAPWDIVQALYENRGPLSGDSVQTVLKSVLVGYLLGSGMGIAVGILIDRLPFLQRGLLPLANLTSTIPLVGVAPIAVMWFGFDWPSKAAVIVLVTFFPALVSTLAGLQASGKLERELMYCYAATPRKTLWVLRLPAALPFIFNALKVNSTLALISAIVAEFFGSPTSGLGFRISTEAARMHMSTVWAAIVVASVVGSVFYALLVRLEKKVNFWHPSVRGES